MKCRLHCVSGSLNTAKYNLIRYQSTLAIFYANRAGHYVSFLQKLLYLDSIRVSVNGSNIDGDCITLVIILY